MQADEPPDRAAKDDDDAGRPGSRRLAYNPAIDGLRGVAVAAVLAFHGGYAWARGGYLGVSTFFTLSGFLITSLLVAERRATGRVRLTAFWGRRLRRLFPASAAALAGICLSAVVLDEGWERSLQGDVLAALFQVANWHLLLADRAYADLFASPSPVLHFWSLAIEEQFYWVFPLVAAGVLAVAKGSLKVFGAALAGLVALSAALTLFYGPERSTVVYYATPIRMGEILVGALLAVALAAGLTRSAAVRRAAAVGGPLALAASAFAWWNVGQDSPKLYQGGLLAYACVSAVLVLSATVPGPVRRLLAFEPLRLLGVISYGVYLYHWPVFLILDGERTGLGRGEKLFALRLAVTLAVATASYVLLERPIRRGWRPTRPPLRGMPTAGLAGAALAAVAVVAVVVPRVSAPPEDPFADPAQRREPPTVARSVPPSADVVLTAGDSTMYATLFGLKAWGTRNGDLAMGYGTGGFGCSIMRTGAARMNTLNGPTRLHCRRWEEELADVVPQIRGRLGRVDAVLIQYGPWDVADRQLPGSDDWYHVGEPVVDDYLRREMTAMTDDLLGQGVEVIWLTAPEVSWGRTFEPPPDPPFPESDPARMARYNQLVRAVADSRTGATVVDLAGYLDGLPGGAVEARLPNGELLRPDGVHFTDDAAALVIDQWLGDAVVHAVDAEPHPPPPDR